MVAPTVRRWVAAATLGFVVVATPAPAKDTDERPVRAAGPSAIAAIIRAKIGAVRAGSPLVVEHLEVAALDVLPEMYERRGYEPA